MTFLMSKIIKVDNIIEKYELIEYLKSGTFPTGLDREQRRRYKAKASNFVVVNDFLCFRSENGSLKRVVFGFESEIINLILEEEHRAGHPGMNKLVDLIHRKYYGIPSSVIKEFVRTCDACSSTNTLVTVEDIHINEITRKYDRYIMDCVDLRRYSADNDGYCWILNVIDTYTKFLFSYKMKDKSALSVKECLEHIYMNFGVPVSIQADNGKEFSNQLLREFHSQLNVRVVHGRPRNPRAQGQVERVNQTIKRWLAKTLMHTTEKRWIDHLQSVVFSYNITMHRATNQSPFQLFHGQPGFNGFQPIPEEGELAAVTDENQNENTEEWIFDDEGLLENEEESNIRDAVMNHFANYRRALIANSNPNTRRRIIEVGDRVLLKIDFDNNPTRRRNALDGFFEDAHYVVVEILENNMIKIKNTETEEIKNVFKNRLKKLSQ